MKRSMAMILTGTTILVMTVTATVTGCQSDTSKEKEETLYGEVSKIDGNEITIALGEEPKKPEEGEAPQDENVPPAKPEADGGTGQEDESEETMPEGEIPEGSEPQGGMNPGITLTGEEKTITVDEDTEYQKTGGNMGGPQGEAQEIKDRQEDQEASLDDLEEGDIVTVVLKGDQASSIAIQTMGKGMDESSEGTIALSGVYTVDGEEKTSKEEDFESNSEDENAVLVTGKGTLTMTGATLSKTGDTSSADESNFYAVNAIFAVADHSTALAMRRLNLKRTAPMRYLLQERRQRLQRIILPSIRKEIPLGDWMPPMEGRSRPRMWTSLPRAPTVRRLLLTVGKGRSSWKEEPCQQPGKAALASIPPGILRQRR